MSAFSDGFMTALGAGVGFITVALTLEVTSWLAQLAVPWAAAAVTSHYHITTRFARDTHTS